MEEGFGDNALSYMLVLRLIPLFPFLVVNLVTRTRSSLHRTSGSKGHFLFDSSVIQLPKLGTNNVPNFETITLVPALLGISLRVYIVATLTGVVPGAWVYASVGVGLSSIFDNAEEVSLASVMTPELIIALVGLALLSLATVVYKKIKQRKS